MSEETEETPSIFPLTIGDLTLTRYDGASYVDEDGRTYYSGAGEPSAEDAESAVNTPVNPPDPVVVPSEVGPAQIRVAMRAAGIDPALVDTAIEGIADPIEQANASDLWHKASTIKRDHPLIAALAAQLQLTTQQVDNIFIAAAAI